jgi:DNA-3-methyladenine glycosylase
VQIPYNFYNQNVVEVAKNLLGKKLIFGKHKGIITETEAYRGSDDEASHAYRGITKRSAIMFGPPGHAYIYMIYGMYFCFNIVAEEMGQAGAVLIRRLKLPHIDLNGPGKLCRHLGITKKDNGINLVNSDYFYLTEGIEVKNILSTSRIGITKATDKLWRFVLESQKAN